MVICVQWLTNFVLWTDHLVQKCFILINFIVNDEANQLNGWKDNPSVAYILPGDFINNLNFKKSETDGTRGFQTKARRGARLKTSTAKKHEATKPENRVLREHLLSHQQLAHTAQYNDPVQWPSQGLTQIYTDYRTKWGTGDTCGQTLRTMSNEELVGVATINKTPDTRATPERWETKVN